MLFWCNRSVVKQSKMGLCMCVRAPLARPALSREGGVFLGGGQEDQAVREARMERNNNDGSIKAKSQSIHPRRTSGHSITRGGERCLEHLLDKDARLVLAIADAASISLGI